LNGGREIANEPIRQNKRDYQSTLEETRKAEEAVEREMLIGMLIMI
jgi:hypothetical protein